MQPSKETMEVLKNFSTINSNLVIKSGNKIETISPAKDILASFEGGDEFDKKVSIFNLNEFLGVMSAFNAPSMELDDKEMIITEGKQKVKYVYADESLLIAPPAKSITFPNTDITLEMSKAVLDQIDKMSGILKAPDLAIIGDGETITIKVFDKENPSANTFELGTEVDTTETFQVNIKIERLKVYPGNYTVDISNKKISRFTHDTLNLVYFIALEADSTFA